MGSTTSKIIGVFKVGLEINNVEAGELNTQQMKEFPKIPGVSVKLDVDSTVKPTRRTRSHIPLHFKPMVRQMLVEMLAKGIIERAENDSDWISPIRVVLKHDRSPRIVIDYRGPNKAIKRRPYPLPRIDELWEKLSTASCFARLDISSAYHHVEIDKESRGMLSFMTEFGLIRFARLPFGVSCAPEAWQEIMDNIFRDCQGLVYYMDDFLVYASSEIELEERLAEVLRRMEANHLTLNLSKCQMYTESVDFLGYKICNGKLTPADDKRDAIRDFQRPKSLKDL